MTNEPTSAAGRGYMRPVPSVGAGYTQPPALCRHCGQGPDADGDHTCPCPFSDEECPDHG